MILVLLLLFFVTLILALFYGSMLGTLWSEAPFVPTGRRDLKRMINLVAIKPGEMVYDLGSGDGRIVRAAARLGAKAVGYEKSLPMVWWSKMLAYNVARHFMCRHAGDEAHQSRDWCGAGKLPRYNARFVRANYLKQDLSDADVVFCYLMPKAMEHLKPKFEKELQPGTRIISRAFSIPGWKAEIFRFSKRSPPVYFYIKR
ncbi:MAG: SAM-dependent methyltransferase [Parcubacteria group bacterium GW2011_GWC2_45_7]|nr:MAG: SAM-dependent methyltransferase [Parcubacteria group bacterium GW2011_GWC2_45_7]KKU73171.1 MAG: SAM-dependent methyltransferase [Parcubacteria group bacterium GW2011_GWA2_47_26]